MQKFIVMLCLFASAAIAGCSEKVTDITPDERVISYIGHNNRPVELILDRKTLRVTVRIKSAEDYIALSEDLRYLIREVKRLTAKNMVRLNKDLSFKYEGGHKVWGPYLVSATKATYNCLYFAEMGYIKDGVVHAQGTREQPTGYYDGYSLWEKGMVWTKRK